MLVWQLAQFPDVEKNSPRSEGSGSPPYGAVGVSGSAVAVDSGRETNTSGGKVAGINVGMAVGSRETDWKVVQPARISTEALIWRALNSLIVA